MNIVLKLGGIFAVVVLQWPAVVVQAAPTTIDFDDLTGMGFTSGTPIPVSARLSDQYLASDGVLFGSEGGYVAVVALGVGHAVSGTNGIGGSTPTDLLSYNASNPITIGFYLPSNPSIQAITDFVSVRGDLIADSDESPALSAFDINGQLIDSVTVPDSGGATWTISKAGIHSVQFSMVTVPDGVAGGVALDDFTFNPVIEVPEPSSAFLLIGSVSWLLLQGRRRR